MANSDYITRQSSFGFCPTAELSGGIGALTTAVTMANFSASFADAIRIGMAALIDDEIVSIDARSGNSLTIGRGCCDTVARPHADGALIWFFDDSLGRDEVEYAGSEVISVKVLPKTLSSSAVPIEYSPPKQVNFNFRFARPYPPGLVKVNGANFDTNPTMQAGTNRITLTWAHRNRITQQDQLIPYGHASISPEAGTTYVARVYRDDDVLVRTSLPINALTWFYDWGSAAWDSGYHAGMKTGYVLLSSVRDGLESFQSYRIDFQYDALNAPQPYGLGFRLGESVGGVTL